jgi:hypothetical protein
MSTEIAEIKGRFEQWDKDNSDLEYVECSIHINRFFGGKKGRMIQLTIFNNTDGYIQLTKDQVTELKKVLENCFNNEIYPSE